MHPDGPGMVLVFVDDVLAHAIGQDREHKGKQVQASVNNIMRWCDVANGKINPTKANVVWLSLNNMIVKTEVPRTVVNNEPVKRADLPKYLGVTFDRSLSFRDHVERVTSRSRKSLQAIQIMAGVGLQQSLLYRMYMQLVLPIMEYGLGTLTLSKTQLAKFEVIQNEAMWAILGCSRDTPIMVIRYMLVLPTMEERYDMAQVKLYFRARNVSRHPLHISVKDTKGKRLKRCRSWMARA
jgi:hypothetical protein